MRAWAAWAVGAVARGVARSVAAFLRGLRFALRFAVFALAFGVFLVGALNVAFHAPVDVAYRALDPNSPACSAPAEGWDILADRDVDNDEIRAIARGAAQGVDWATRLRCSIQRHIIAGYQPADAAGASIGPRLTLAYDLAFLEFQENGDPYLLCEEDELRAGRCDGTSYEPKPSGVEARRGQLDALLDRLHRTENNYVVAFVHGWRNDAQIGGGNVADLRVYAAHAARFVADRCAWGDQRFCGMRTTAIFVGWRGARTDERALAGAFRPLADAFCGERPCWIDAVGDFVAGVPPLFTLFDRKPVSEAVAPSAISALLAVENRIGLLGAFRQQDLAPCESEDDAKSGVCLARGGAGPQTPQPSQRMIVFGHSLGGNLLATGLKDEMVKLVERHAPADMLPPPLGNLVVLLNPASEAAKWTEVQRAVWRRTAMSGGDMARFDDLVAGRAFFRADQRPVVVAATAARDWPPGGIWAADCPYLLRMARAPDTADSRNILREFEAEAERRGRSIDYDWATYDVFPAFRFDFRPLASSLERYAVRGPPSANPMPGAPADYPHLLDACSTPPPQGPLGHLAHWIGAFLRVFPFANVDAEQTRTIGHLDPPRSAQGLDSGAGFSGRPFGTTHELLGWDSGAPSARRQETLPDDSALEERRLSYADIGGPAAQCPLATHWLSRARAAKIAAGNTSAIRWDAGDLKEGRPALRFEHGFYPAHLPPITRANDPFWNLRALDNALAKHDGYMLSSFICAMQQLVLDDVTKIEPPPNAGSAAAP